MSSADHELCPLAAPGEAAGHDWELFQTSRTEHIYMCMLCEKEIRVPLDMKPADVVRGEG